jgi:hypothetical protein
LKGRATVTVNEPQYVPKVHPATRAVEADDPMMLFACPTVGDPELMVQCLVQEYAWMGFDAPAIVCLFRDQEYPALNALWAHYGEEWIRARVQSILGMTGVHRCSGTVTEEAQEIEEDSHFIELGLERLAQTGFAPTSEGERNQHASGQ